MPDYTPEAQAWCGGASIQALEAGASLYSGVCTIPLLGSRSVLESLDIYLSSSDVVIAVVETAME